MERSTGPCEAPFSDALAPVHPTLNTSLARVCDGCCGSAHATGPSDMTGWKARCCASPSATRPSVRPGRVACAVIWPCSLSADNLPDGATACAQASQWRTHRRSRSSTPFSANSRAGHKPVRARVHVVKRGGWGKVWFFALTLARVLGSPADPHAPARSAGDATGAGAKPFLYVLNLVRTKHITGVKRGARTKAMAICTQHQFLHVYKVRPPCHRRFGNRSARLRPAHPRRSASLGPVHAATQPSTRFVATDPLAATVADCAGPLFRHTGREVRACVGVAASQRSPLPSSSRVRDGHPRSILQELYQAVNQMDLSDLPALTQQQKRIIRASDTNDQEKR